MKYLIFRVLVASIFSILAFVPTSNAYNPHNPYTPSCSNIIYFATNHLFNSCENLSKKLVKIQKYEDKITNEEFKLENGIIMNDQKLNLNLLKQATACNNKKQKLQQKIFFLETKLSGFGGFNDGFNNGFGGFNSGFNNQFGGSNSGFNCVSNNCFSNNCNFGFSNFCFNSNNGGFNSGNWYKQTNKLFNLYAKLDNTTAKCAHKLASYEYNTYWWSQKKIQKAHNKIENYKLKIYEAELDAIEDYNDIDKFNEVIISCGGSPQSCFNW